jgi:hypothetical protein
MDEKSPSRPVGRNDNPRSGGHAHRPLEARPEHLTAGCPSAGAIWVNIGSLRARGRRVENGAGQLLLGHWEAVRSSVRNRQELGERPPRPSNVPKCHFVSTRGRLLLCGCGWGSLHRRRRFGPRLRRTSNRRPPYPLIATLRIAISAVMLGATVARQAGETSVNP